MILGHLIGERSGRKFGPRLNTVQRNVEDIRIKSLQMIVVAMRNKITIQKLSYQLKIVNYVI